MANGWNCSRKAFQRLPAWPCCGNRAAGGETLTLTEMEAAAKALGLKLSPLRYEALTILREHSHERKGTAPKCSLRPQIHLLILSNAKCWTSRQRTGCRRCTKRVSGLRPAA